ncbi:MAG: hypothetical protein P4L75_04020 [Clostridia bacterium]|nr:hypothetical protein [Clostridia bacterium]MDR3644021.1 hypothetical protein [Clostridia bacterium]
MPKQSDFSPEAVNAMLKMASSKLGMTPEQLKATLTDPKKANELLDSVNKKSGSHIKPSANNERTLEDLLNSNPQAKKLISELLGEKKDG